MQELWKDVEGYEGKYRISSQGRVESLITNKIKKTPLSRNGYLRVELWNKGELYFTSIHRLVAIAFVANPNNYDVVNHKDGNKLNNIPSNLEWTTSSQNALHSCRVLKKGIREKHPMAKLTEYQVRELRKEFSASIPRKQIATKYKISLRVVYYIANGTLWNEEHK